jgi:hypothetical protein
MDDSENRGFRALAVHALRQHRGCSDVFRWDGWPEVNVALASYALDRRRARATDEAMHRICKALRRSNLARGTDTESDEGGTNNGTTILEG